MIEDAELMLIQLPTGVSLQVQLESPAESSSASETKLAILLHPWSWLGGNMRDPVLHSLVIPLLQANYHVLRYNSRGVGGSSGWRIRDLTGLSEANDLQALIQWGIEYISSVTSVVVIVSTNNVDLVTLIDLSG